MADTAFSAVLLGQPPVSVANCIPLQLSLPVVDGSSVMFLPGTKAPRLSSTALSQHSCLPSQDFRTLQAASMPQHSEAVFTGHDAVQTLLYMTNGPVSVPQASSLDTEGGDEVRMAEINEDSLEGELPFLPRKSSEDGGGRHVSFGGSGELPSYQRPAFLQRR